MNNLKAEATTLGKPAWRDMLCYVARLHQQSIHPQRAPFSHAWEEIGPGYVSSPAFGHWDIVHQILDVLPAEPEHARRQILNDLANQQDDGFVPGVIWMKSGEARWSATTTHPPVWPAAVDEWTHVTGSTELIERCFTPLSRQLLWFEQHRAAEPAGFYYTDIATFSWESGVDEGIRFDHAQPGRFACIDATAHVYQLADRAAAWAATIGQPAGEYAEKAAALRQFIRQELFDAETGWYHDIWARRDPTQRRDALEGMWPLVTGAASEEQAQRVVEALLDPERFFTSHPVSTVAVCEPAFELRMWRGPAWNSMTLWAARGCLRYGYTDAARLLAEKALDASAQQFERTATIWEFYHPHGGDPRTVQRKPQSRPNQPCPAYLGHNPLLALARIFDTASSPDKINPGDAA
jgi:glycogen debranching enzyme